ncbi:MAG: hypothetical protein WC939_04655 [Acholeplasmataceae bacterium]
MKIKADIDYGFDEKPRAIVRFMGKRRNIYPVLSKSMQKKVNSSYEFEEVLTISKVAFKSVFEWELLLKEIMDKLRPDLKVIAEV